MWISKLLPALPGRSATSPIAAAAWVVLPVVFFFILPTNVVLAREPFYFQAHGTSVILLIMLWTALTVGLWLIISGLLWFARRNLSDVIFDLVTSLITLGAAFVALFSFIGVAIENNSWSGFNLLLGILGVVPVNLLSVVVALALASVFTQVTRRSVFGPSVLTIVLIASQSPLIIHGVQEDAVAAEQPTAMISEDVRPDILWIVADEMQYSATFDSDGLVRPFLPELARLQSISTTFTNAYATSTHTQFAVPAQLNGVSRVDKLTSSQVRGMQKSSGVLAWLRDEYSVLTLSDFFNTGGVRGESLASPEDFFNADQIDPLRSVAANTANEMGVWNRIALLAADTAVVTANVGLHPRLSSTFPEIGDRWTDFWNPTAGKFLTDVSEWTIPLGNVQGPVMAFWHDMTPHSPLILDFAGQRLGMEAIGTLGVHGQPLSDELESLQRRLYLASLVEVDRRLGTVLNVWFSRANAENSMVIFTSDHGRTFVPGAATTRSGSPHQRWSGVAHVPLIVKFPGQTHPDVVRSARSTGQIAGSVLEVLSARVEGKFPQSRGLLHDLPDLPLPANPQTGIFSEEEARFWFSEGEMREDESWDESDLRSPDQNNPFYVGPPGVGFGSSVPSNMREVDTEQVEVWSGDSSYDILKITVAEGQCESGSGIIAREGTVVGSLLWENPPSPQIGWSLVPRELSVDVKVWC